MPKDPDILIRQINMLHIIKSQSGLTDAINLIQPDDAVLLVEDAVYALFHQSSPLIGLKDQKRSLLGVTGRSFGTGFG